MSSTTLTFNENVLIGLGLSFYTQPDKGDIVPTAAALDSFVTRSFIQPGNRDLMKGLISPMLISIRDHAPLLPKRLNEALRSLTRRTNLKILPAD